MDKQFWLGRWNDHNIGFHRDEYSENLTQYWDQFAQTTEPVFVPLCGKSKDLLFLAERGHKVIGVELSQKAIIDFFEGNGISFIKSEKDGLILYHSDLIDIFHGDFFDLKFAHLMSVKYVYDRASLVALPEDIRIRYVQFFCRELSSASIFLETINNKDSEKSPPFYVSNIWIDQHFTAFQRELISSDGEFTLNTLSPLS